MRKLIQKLKLFYRKLLIKIEENIFILPDNILYLFSKKKIKNEKCIVFAGTYMHARIARIAKWIKKTTDYQSVLIAQKSVFTPQLSNDSFDQVHLFRNKWHLLSILKKYSGQKVIVHSFGPPHFAAYHIAVENSKKPSNAKQNLFFDYQDLMVSNFGLRPPFLYMKKEISKEKFILKNVDGIISHSLELQTAKKYYGKDYPPILFFPIYADNDSFVKEKKSDKNDFEQLSLVYVGGVYSKFRNKSYFGGQHLHWLIHKLNKQKVHFHIYPAPTNKKEDIQDYVEMNRSLKYFHLHEPLPQANLISEIAKYDYGVIPFFHRTNKKLNDKRHYSTSMKLFNFFEAGLPVIMGKDIDFQNFIGRKFGAAITLDYEDFDNLEKQLEHIDYKELVENLVVNREYLSLKNKIHKLIEFYNKTGLK